MEEKIKEIICEIKKDETLMDTLSNTSNIINEVGFDSLQMINFILKVEDEFGVEIDFEEFDMEHLESLGTFCAFLKEGL